MDPYIIEFGHYGVHLGTRFLGASIREKVESIFKETEKIVFNFVGVETVSKSFADECFAKLLFKFSFEEIKSKTTYEGASPFIKAVITNEIKERIEEAERRKQDQHENSN